MKVGDMIKMVTSYRDDLNRLGLLISIERRPGPGVAGDRRDHRVATVMISTGELVTWPLDSHYQIEVINESR